MSTIATDSAMTDQTEVDEQRKLVEQSELWFWSEIHEKTYVASELCSLSDDLIRQLLSEATAVFAQVDAVTGEIESRKRAGLDWNFDWYVRVRKKRGLTKEFKALVSRELKHRNMLAALPAVQVGLERKVKSLEKKLADLEKAKPQKKYEYEKRKKFYELIVDAIGKPAFDEFMLEAAKSASLLYPGPWAEIQGGTGSNDEHDPDDFNSDSHPSLSARARNPQLT